MRVAGKLRSTVASDEFVERVGNAKRPGAQLFNCFAHVEPQCGEHLIVARTAGVQTPAGRADAFRQQILERGLTVFMLEAHLPFAARMRIADRDECIADLLQIIGRDQPARAQHFRVRDGRGDVMLHQPIVEHVIFARGVAQYALIQRLALVPETCH